MGCPRNALIPAAILLDNPGITREEFVELLNQTHSAPASFITERAELVSYDEMPDEDESFHWGLHGLATLLHIEQTREFGFHEMQYQLSKGVLPPVLKIVAQKKSKKWPAPRFEVTVYSYHSLEEGIREKIEKFSSIEELVKEHPYFNPDFMYNFSVEKGSIKADMRYGSFGWKKINERYYLDKEYAFNEIPEERVLGYINLILTAEAIKKRAWKLFAKDGFIFLDDFLKEFPDSKERYGRAIWDSYTSFDARERGMTNSEFLRWRLQRLSEL